MKRGAWRAALGLLAGLAGGAAEVVAQSGIFRAPSTARLGAAAASLVVVDADADGVQDVCVAAEDGLWITAAASDGSLTQGIRLALGGAVTSLAGAAIDADDLEDLVAVVRDSESLLFLPGVGSRTPVENPVGSGFVRFFGIPDEGMALGAAPIAVALGDFDGDQRWDAAVSLEGGVDTDPGTVVLLKGDGAGGFIQLGSPLEVGAGATQLVAADFDADTVVDLAVLEAGEGTARLFLGAGDGSFAAGTEIDLPGTPVALAAVEVDGTTGAELAATAGAVGGAVVLDFRDPGFEEIARWATGSGPAGVTGVDVDGDDRDEVVVANRRSFDVAIASGAVVRRFVAGDEALLVAGLELGPDMAPALVAIGGGDASSTAYLLRPRDRTYQATSVVPLAEASDSVAFDADGDGWVDLVAVGGSRLVAHSLRGESVHVLAELDLPEAAASLTGYLDAAGQPRVAVTLPQAGIVRVLRLYDGAWQGLADIAVGVAPQEILASDVTGDGVAELVVAGAEIGSPVVVSGTVAIECGGSGPGFAARVRRMAALDANCDGLQDLAVVDASQGTVSVLAASDDGCLSPLVDLDLSGASPASLAVADFDADGVDDLAVGSDFDITNRPVRFYYGDCVSPLVPAPFSNWLPGGQTLADLAMVDVDANRLVDVVAASSSSNQARTSRGSSIDPSGFATFRAAVTDDTSRRPERLAVADWNADGTYDLAATNIDVNAQLVSIAWNCTAEDDCSPFGGGVGVREARGDGNLDGAIGAADFSVLAAELVDGDGLRVEDAVRLGVSSSYGVDANGDAKVDRQDLAALARRYFAE